MLIMPAFLYRCPFTGINVQGWVADDPTASDDNRHELVTCLACRQLHLVNPKTGKVIAPRLTNRPPRLAASFAFTGCRRSRNRAVDCL